MARIVFGNEGSLEIGRRRSGELRKMLPVSGLDIKGGYLFGLELFVSLSSFHSPIIQMLIDIDDNYIQ
jgi:hypothetical protein